METITPTGRTPSATVLATRPTTAVHGVACDKLLTGTLATANMLLYVEGDGSGQTLDKPTGGPGGAELWGYRTGSDGVTKKWWLIQFLNGRTIVPVAGGGYIEQVIAGAGPVFERLCVAGTPAVSTTMTYFFEALERFIG